MLDRFESEEELLGDTQRWWRVLKNVRAGIMPPNGLLRPTEEEFQLLSDWIKQDVFNTDYENPDPGKVTLRRLNRIEYSNTIRDLMGVRFNAEAEFPPDDTGYGFDIIGDVLSISPLLLEKYLQAAETIVQQAVPTITKIMPEKELSGRSFRSDSGDSNGSRMTFYEAAKVSYTFEADREGDYRLVLDLDVNGTFDFDPGKCRVVFSVDGEPLFEEEYSWADNEDFEYEFEVLWQEGEHVLTFELHPLTPVEEKLNRLDFEIDEVRIQGPLDKRHWVNPENYERFFHRDEPPEDEEERERYAREVLDRFSLRAFRRPADESTIDRLVAIARATYSLPEKTFEEGIAQAMIAVLASPRFLFRVEETLPQCADEKYPLIDEYALASRLSYFFWSTMPDEELLELARRGELRNQLESQVTRMMEDPRIEAFIENFTGQWLQARDIEHVPINARAALGLPRRRRGGEQIEFDRETRRAMRQETELVFEYIMKEDRDILEFVDSDYTFLNEKLAEHYGIPDVKGNEMRLVRLPEDSPRGGVLTQGTFLAVTSNPTRTSPVKRGVYMLENLLGTPAPPPPPDIPTLEVVEKEFGDREPTMRELVEFHRRQPMCQSCHARFDPIGMALENFNAMGMWRDTENDQPIDATGQLITGETFSNILELKRILKENHQPEVYRCFTEKVLIYAIGRGLDYYDEHTIDQIVEKLEQEDGRFSVLITGIVESAPFQRQRTVVETAARPSEQEHEKEPEHEEDF